MIGTSAGSASATTGRQALLGDDAAAAPPAATTDAGTRGLAALQDTQRLANDTEAMGMSILGQLGTQRGQLQSAIERREDAHQNLSVSSRLIRQMNRRATWQKLTLCGIISLLVAGILLIVYLQWFSGHKTPASPPPSPLPALTAAAAGRALQFDLSPSPPPSVAPTPQERGGIGPGIIILIVVGGIAAAVCFMAIPRGLLLRTILVTTSFFLF